MGSFYLYTVLIGAKRIFLESYPAVRVYLAVCRVFFVFEALAFRAPARVAELVDALDLGSSSGDRMGVQVSPLAPHLNTQRGTVRIARDRKGH